MSLGHLMRLTSQGRAVVDERFLRGEIDRLPDDPVYATPIMDHPRVEFEGLRLDVPEGTLGPQQDVTVALQLHRRLRIRRGVAVDAQMWAWLGARYFADLLRRRWTTGARLPKPARFVGRLVDHGLARLWWAAELTREDGASEREHGRAVGALLSSQYRTDRLLSMALLRHAPAMLGVLDAVGKDIRWQVLNEICHRLGLMATTYAVVAMTREEVRELVEGLYEDVIAHGEFSDAREPDRYSDRGKA